jgi:hypothetical protein
LVFDFDASMTDPLDFRKRKSSYFRKALHLRTLPHVLVSPT